MNRMILLGLAAVVAQCVLADETSDKLTKASKRLADAANYSWTMVTTEADGSPGKVSPIEGKTEKGGITYLNFVVGGVPVEVCMKGNKGSAKALEGWQTFDEIAQTGGTAAAVVRFLRSYKVPAAECKTLVSNTKGLKEEAETFAGDLNEDATKEFLLLGARRKESQEAPKTSDIKGSVKFWAKDGGVTKYEIKTQGKVSSGDRESTINRTITVELRDVGTTKTDVPKEAIDKLG